MTGAAQLNAAGLTAPLRPLKLIPGCNSLPEVIRAQIRTNVQRELPWLEIVPAHDRPLAIVAGGPSLKYRWQELLNFSGDILALNNAYGFLVGKGITPNSFMLLDARAENVDFLRPAQRQTRHYLAAQCHPSVYDALRDFGTTLYITTLPDILELVAGIEKPKVQIAGSVGTVGIKALSLAYALGYRELHLYGYDSSYEGAEHHAFAQPLNDDARLLDVWLNGKQYQTTPTLAHQAQEFCEFSASMVKNYGCSIDLHCSGLLPDMVIAGNARGEIPIEQREREKYEEVWAHDKYRKEAPGESLVKLAIETMRMKPGQSVLDFGCGTGRASVEFQRRGFEVLAIDFAANSLDPNVEIPFVQACLWDLPDIYADWGFCTDVMEHIPMEKVIAVLEGIACRCKGCFFSIATADDHLGLLIGKKLHMTVTSAEIWAQIMSRIWSRVAIWKSEGGVMFAVTERKTQ